MSYYAVIDTNVLVSALLTKYDDAATVQIVGKMIKGEIVPLYNKEIILEYSEVLNRRKFKFLPELIENILLSIVQFGVNVDAAPTGHLLPDMKDLPFYEVVYEKKDEGAYLITGNLKHFPVKPFIVTARQMLDIINSDQ